VKQTIYLEWQLFLLAVRFLTRFRVPQGLPNSDDLTVRSTKFHPLVGGLIGVITGGILLITAQLVPWHVAVLLAIIAGLLATGAFHELGLARAVDAISSGRDRQEAFEILDATYMGAFGILALGMAMALKIGVLVAMPLDLAVVGGIAGHAIGRMATVHIVWTTYTARDLGARARVPGVTPDGYLIALLCSVICIIPLWLLSGTAAVLCAFLGAVLMGQLFRLIIVRKLGGYTGNCLGGVQQMGEIGTYLGLAVWL
jgi:adenosylcobinamide-GDP ribazoletransferase